MNGGAGLIVNPKSGGDNVRGRELARMLAEGGGGTRVVLLEDFARLEPALREMTEAGVEALFISSGDGTIQAVQTWLAENLSAERLPLLALLPHGSTNMTAADLGFTERDVAAQRDFIANAGWRRPTARIVRRPSLRIAETGEGRPLHGMFLGGGAIATGTLFCQRQFNRRGVRGNMLAPALTLALAAGRALLAGPARPEDEARLDRPAPMRIRVDGEVLGEGLHLALLATTLEKLVFGARPFLPGGEGRLKVAVFGHPPPSLARWLPAVLWGRKEGRRFPPQIRMLHAERLEVETPAPFVLDGEAVSPPASGPLVVTPGPRFSFLRGAG